MCAFAQELEMQNSQEQTLHKHTQKEWWKKKQQNNDQKKNCSVDRMQKERENGKKIAAKANSQILTPVHMHKLIVFAHVHQF